METKTLERIVRRLQRLPLHHIDTSVILEPANFGEERTRNKYIQKLGYNYRGKMSFPVLSELFLKFLFLETEEERDTFKELMDHLRIRRKTEFYSPKSIGKLMEEISEMDSRLEPTDIQIVACAIEDRADVIITLDKNLIGHTSIKEKYGLEICHPKNFI